MNERSGPNMSPGTKDATSAAVVIIGGGIAGICMAIDLVQRAGCRNFVVLEKAASLGGTWNDNRYPGCACDVPSVLYSFSFAQNTEWTRAYPGQEEILDYLRRVAQRYNIYQYLRFNSVVEAAQWDDETRKWKIHVSTVSGSKEAEAVPEYDILADFLISAVGQLNVPKWPVIRGLDNYRGKRIHSARWDWSYDLTGKKVALIGNGCSAVQIVPEIAKVAKHVTIFQRTPNWIIPRLDRPISRWVTMLYRCLPGALSLARALEMDRCEWVHGIIRNKDSEVANFFTKLSTEMLQVQLAADADLRSKVTPQYDMGCRRIIVSDDYYSALLSENVSLETRPIRAMDGRAIQVSDPGLDGSHSGPAHEYEVLVCATGFQTLEFMHSIELCGRGGRSIRDVWSGGAQALYGVTVEDMPNFGMLYGPNTNLGHNSIILMIEAQSRYIAGLVGEVLTAHRKGESLVLTPRTERVKTFNETLQTELESTVFSDEKCGSWYKTADGQITNNWSRNVVEYQKLLAYIEVQDFDIESTGSGTAQAMQRKKRIHVGRVYEGLWSNDRAWSVMSALTTVAVVVGGMALYRRKFASI